MPARTPVEAVRALVGPLQRAASCVTSAVLIAEGHRSRVEPYFLTFPGRAWIRLAGEHELSLRASLRYLIQRSEAGQRSWMTEVVGYEYELQDGFAQRILAYHWHPVGRSAMTSPHLHIRQAGPIDLTHVHLPTGCVPLTAVQRLAIAELGIRPLRPDWANVLDEAERALQTR